MRPRLDGTKELNRRLILQQIRRCQFVSRSEIAYATRLSKAAVSSIVAELIDAGLVRETGSQSAAIGRPRILLSLIPDAAYALGVELTNQECRVILTDLRAEPVVCFTQAVSPADLSVATLLDVLESSVAHVTRDLDPALIVGMGVCVPGIVDPTTGVIALSVILPWRNVTLTNELARRFPHFPAAVFSRGNAATWGERWYGVGQQARNLLYVRVGDGLVAGLVLEGQPYFGQGFGAGELGHVTVHPNGAPCRCGNRGCLATVATVEALLGRVSQLLREHPTNPLWTQLDTNLEALQLADVLQAAAVGNPVALQALAETGRWLAVAIASAVNLLNLDMVIIGGPLEAAGAALLDPLRAELRQRALPTHLARLTVVASALKQDAPAVGAASLVLHALMSPTPLPVKLANFGDKATLLALTS